MINEKRKITKEVVIMRSYVYDGQITHYQISENGDLYNEKTNNYPKGWINSQGYRCYYLNIDGKSKTFFAHRLVAETFIPNNDPKKDCVNHIDGNKLNNHITNLEWVSKVENNRHAREVLHVSRKKKVYCYNKNKQLVCTYESLNEAAAMTGFAINSIADCAISEKKALCHGYFWSYVDDNTFEIIETDKRHKKPIGRYDLNGQLLEEYESITQAADLTHFPNNRLSDCARGKIKTYGGYIWKFL